MKIVKKIISFFVKVFKRIKLFFYQWWKEEFKNRRLILSKPIEKYSSLKIKSGDLLGFSFYFLSPRNHKIYSPLNGRVERIYLDNKTILLKSEKGLQVILTIKANLNSDDSIFEIIKWVVKEEQEVKKSTVLSIIYFREKISNVAVIIPWQPLLVKKISNPLFWERKTLAKVFFLSKKDKPRIRRNTKLRE